MKFTTVFFALIPLVYALPTPESDLQPQVQGSVHVCTNRNFEEPCANLQGISGECVNVPVSFENNISAVGPDAEQDCFFFVDRDCGGAVLGPLRFPGNANLGGTAFNDAISSFQCFFG